MARVVLALRVSCEACCMTWAHIVLCSVGCAIMGDRFSDSLQMWIFVHVQTNPSGDRFSDSLQMWILVHVQTLPMHACQGAFVNCAARRFFEHSLGIPAGICRNASGVTRPRLPGTTRVEVMLFQNLHHAWISRV